MKYIKKGGHRWQDIEKGRVWEERTDLFSNYRYNFFFKLVGWDFGYCGHYWPIVPAPGDR
jgi:hypothetical protein